MFKIKEKEFLVVIKGGLADPPKIPPPPPPITIPYDPIDDES